MLPLYIRAVTKEKPSVKRKRLAQAAEIRRRESINRLLERDTRQRERGVGPKFRAELQFRDVQPDESGHSTTDPQAEYWSESSADVYLDIHDQDVLDYDTERDLEWREDMADDHDISVQYYVDGGRMNEINPATGYVTMFQ